MRYSTKLQYGLFLLKNSKNYAVLNTFRQHHNVILISKRIILQDNTLCHNSRNPFILVDTCVIRNDGRGYCAATRIWQVSLLSTIPIISSCTKTDSSGNCQSYGKHSLFGTYMAFIFKIEVNQFFVAKFLKSLPFFVPVRAGQDWMFRDTLIL